MNYDSKMDNVDFHKNLELFTERHKNECMNFLKGDAFGIKLDREYSEDFNRVLGQQRMFFNIRLKKEFDKFHPKDNLTPNQEYLREVDFNLYKKEIVNYLAQENSGYNSVLKAFRYDPEVDPINCSKDVKTGEYRVKTAGAAFNIVEKTKNSVETFLTSKKEESSENTKTNVKKNGL